jgi:hypothetical protein
VGSTSAEEEEHGGFGRFAAGFWILCGGHGGSEGEAEAGGGRSREKGSATET